MRASASSTGSPGDAPAAEQPVPRPDKSATVDRLSDCLTEVRVAVDVARHSVVHSFSVADVELPEYVREEAILAFGTAFDRLSHAVVSAASELSAGEEAALKSKMHEQKESYEMKLAQTRKANSVGLKNAKAEMTAAYNVQLENTMREMVAGGNAPLKALHAQLEEANAKLEKMSKLEQTLQGMCRQRDDAAARSDYLQGELTEGKMAAVEGLASFDPSASEMDAEAIDAKRMARLVGLLVEACKEAHGALADELEDARAQEGARIAAAVGVERAKHAEALAEAKRAAAREGQQLNALLADAARQREEAQAELERAATERAAVASQLTELYTLRVEVDECKDTMRRALEQAEEMKSLRQLMSELDVKHTQVRDEVKTLATQLAEANEQLGDEPDAGRKLVEARAALEVAHAEARTEQQRLQAVVDAARAEIDEMRAAGSVEQNAMLKAELAQAHGDIERLRRGSVAEAWAEVDRVREEERKCRKILGEIPLLHKGALPPSRDGAPTLYLRCIEVVSSYHEAFGSVGKMRAALQQAADATEALTGEANAERAASHAQRTALVAAALSSMRQLGTHLTQNLAGLRVAAGEDPFSRRAVDDIMAPTSRPISSSSPPLTVASLTRRASPSMSPRTLGASSSLPALVLGPRVSPRAAGQRWPTSTYLPHVRSERPPHDVSPLHAAASYFPWQGDDEHAKPPAESGEGGVLLSRPARTTLRHGHHGQSRLRDPARTSPPLGSFSSYTKTRANSRHHSTDLPDPDLVAEIGENATAAGADRLEVAAKAAKKKASKAHKEASSAVALASRASVEASLEHATPDVAPAVDSAPPFWW